MNRRTHCQCYRYPGIVQRAAVIWWHLSRQEQCGECAEVYSADTDAIHIDSGGKLWVRLDELFEAI
jgi:hypothetical protein